MKNIIDSLLDQNKVELDDVDIDAYHRVYASFPVLKYFYNVPNGPAYVLDFCKHEVPYLSTQNRILENNPLEAIQLLRNHFFQNSQSLVKTYHDFFQHIPELNNSEDILNSNLVFSAEIRRNLEVDYVTPVFVKSTPLLLSKKGQVALTFNTLHLSHRYDKDYLFLYCPHQKYFIQRNATSWEKIHLHLDYRHFRIIELMAMGVSDDQIAKEVSLSPLTVRSYIRDLRLDFHQNNRVSLGTLFRALGII